MQLVFVMAVTYRRYRAHDLMVGRALVNQESRVFKRFHRHLFMCNKAILVMSKLVRLTDVCKSH